MYSLMIEQRTANPSGPRSIRGTSFGEVILNGGGEILEISCACTSQFESELHHLGTVDHRWGCEVRFEISWACPPHVRFVPVSWRDYPQRWRRLFGKQLCYAHVGSNPTLVNKN